MGASLQARTGHDRFGCVSGQGRRRIPGVNLTHARSLRPRHAGRVTCHGEATRLGPGRIHESRPWRTVSRGLGLLVRDRPGACLAPPSHGFSGLRAPHGGLAGDIAPRMPPSMRQGPGLGRLATLHRRERRTDEEDDPVGSLAVGLAFVRGGGMRTRVTLRCSMRTVQPGLNLPDAGAVLLGQERLHVSRRGRQLGPRRRGLDQLQRRRLHPVRRSSRGAGRLLAGGGEQGASGPWRCGCGTGVRPRSSPDPWSAVAAKVTRGASAAMRPPTGTKSATSWLQTNGS